jgi:predicted ATPase with chaperone activity
LEKAISAFALSPRAMHRSIAVARTIARLRGAQEAEAGDLDEALSFRSGLSRSVV